MAKRRFRKRLPRPEPIGSLLDRSGDSRFAPSHAPITRQQWAQAVGVTVADRTQPTSLERGVLVVRAATSAWAQELSLLQNVISERLAAMGVSIDELRFRVGSVEPLPRPPDRLLVRRVPTQAALPGPLRRAIDRVEDEQLRDTLARAAQASLAWERK